MAVPRRILVVDDDDHSRFVLTKLLLRQYPRLVMLECCECEVAATSVAFERLDLVVVHRAANHSGLEVIRALRRVSPVLPLVLVSGGDSQEALAAGATRCLSSDESLQIAHVAAEVCAEKATHCA